MIFDGFLGEEGTGGESVKLIGKKKIMTRESSTKRKLDHDVIWDKTGLWCKFRLLFLTLILFTPLHNN